MEYLALLKRQFNNQISLHEKRKGIFQLVAPLYHEDGDMVDIFLESSSASPGLVKVCDHGMTLMRLSYDFELNTANKERVFQQIQLADFSDGRTSCRHRGYALRFSYT